MEAWITIIRDKVNALLDSLDKDWIPNLRAFVKYVDCTWIGELNGRTSQRRPPMFPLQQWNNYKAVLEDRDGTNNHAEGYVQPRLLAVGAHPRQQLGHHGPVQGGGGKDVQDCS